MVGVAEVRNGSRIRRALLAVLAIAALCLATLSVGAVGPAGAQSSEGELPPVVLERRLNGVAAIQALGDRLPAVAALNGRSAAAFSRLLRSDDTAWVDRRGQLLYIDDFLPPAKAAPSDEPEQGPFPYSQTFLLHSRPGSQRVIYLDFTGHTVSGTSWNDNEGVAATFHPAFDTDGNPGTFSNGEQDVIQSVFQRVAEDFAPFAVDVTTQDPGAAAIDRSSASDVNFGTRALISPSSQAAGAICNNQCGGVAYLSVFSRTPSHAYFQPAWVFPQALGNTAKNIAEATTHEVGHNIGLNHDGVSGVTEYYQGHGSWAPIMGVGYSKPIVQWSRGEYTGANNTEDDFAVAGSNGLPLRTDDHGGTASSNTNLGSTGGAVLTGSGVVSSTPDLDAFRFTQTCSGTTVVTVNPAPNSPNLDVRLRVLTAGGTQLATANPTSGGSGDVATGLGATASVALSAATYVVEIDGVGALNPANTGYSDYGSRGAFTVSVRPCGTVTSIAGVVRTSGDNPVPLKGALVTVVGSALPPASTNSAGAYSFPSVPPGTYTVRVERLCKSTQTRSVTVDGPERVDFNLANPQFPNCTVVTQTWVNGTTVLPLTGDDAATTVALPFPYRHYGTDYAAAHVTTNGFVNFLAQDTAYNNTSIPKPEAPNAAVYGFWDDLSVDSAANVRTATVGTAPNRRFVIEWNNVALLSDPTRRFDFEVILSENRSRVLLQYRDIDAGTDETGTSATVGKENAAGDAANQVIFDKAGLLFDGLSVAPK